MARMDELMAAAGADPEVHGVVLTGSHARGLATEHSDRDVTLVVAEQAVGRWQRIRTSQLDQVAVTPAELADTSVHWQRYSYRGARVLLDRLDGGVSALVERQAVPTAEEAARWSREFLDAYVNQLYRAVKSRRDGATAAARLDEIESVPWLLATVFALHGRLRPYNKYLAWELASFPLPGDWTTAMAPERVGESALALFPAVEELARQRGLGDVLDAWGADIGLIRSTTVSGSSDYGGVR